MKVIMLMALTILLTSCSQINVDEQERYRKNNIDPISFRHGIVPVSIPASAVMVKIPDGASVSRGKTLYENHCISCHGPKGEGNGPLAAEQKIAPSNLRKLVKEVPDFDFFMSVSSYKGNMPGWKNKFNEAELEDIKSYLKTL